jgi:hypothetical protein
MEDDLKHHTRNLSTVLEGILRTDEPVKEKAKRIEHRVRGFLQCLESLRLELEVRESDRDKGPQSS